LVPIILALQGQNAQLIQTLHELTLTQSLAENQYVTLAATVDQVEIAAQDAGNAIKIVSSAAVPQKPSGAGLTLVTLAAAGAGLIVGVLVAVSRDWFRAGYPSQPHSDPNPVPDDQATPAATSSKRLRV